MDPGERELILAAIAGDAQAFERLLCKHDRRLLQVSHGIMGNMQDAYDAYQNGIIRAFTRLDSFRFESSFGTWLTRIVINQSLNLKKKLRWSRRLSLEGLIAGGDEPQQIDEPPADELMIRVELSAEIQKSLDMLSDRERSVFVLKHQHGYKLREIALMIDCAEGTVKNYLFRATKKMKTALVKHGTAYGTATAVPSVVTGSGMGER
jgi:RNA polymerase sigma-70 factor, ECF subfamily